MLTAIDVCAGAGGLSLGLHRAGFDVLGVEQDEDAAATHVANVGPCIVADICDYHPAQHVNLVSGGVPCQTFSQSGKRDGFDDPRGLLYLHLLRIAVEGGASVVLLENVRGLLSWRDEATGIKAIHTIETAFRAHGYEPVRTLVNAADYGVPQFRVRLFIAGFRDPSMRAAFRWPSPTHGPPGNLFGLPPWVTVRQALGLGSASYRSGLAEGAAGWQGMRDVDAPSPTVGGGRNAERLSPLDAPAPTMKANAAHEGRSERPSQRKYAELTDALSLLDRPACTTIHDESADKTKPRRRPQVALRQAVAGAMLDAPSPTIVAGRDPTANRDVRERLAADLETAGLLDRPSTTMQSSGTAPKAGHHESHQTGAVRLTVAQCAALQDFPAGFVFHGSTLTSQFKQCGNAVPPALGEAVGRSVAAAIRAGRGAVSAAKGVA